MRHVPVIGMLSAFLGKVRPGARRAELVRLIAYIVTGLGNALSTEVPVKRADVLGVAV